MKIEEALIILDRENLLTERKAYSEMSPEEKRAFLDARKARRQKRNANRKEAPEFKYLNVKISPRPVDKNGDSMSNVFRVFPQSLPDRFSPASFEYSNTTREELINFLKTIVPVFYGEFKTGESRDRNRSWVTNASYMSKFKICYNNGKRGHFPELTKEFWYKGTLRNIEIPKIVSIETDSGEKLI